MVVLHFCFFGKKMNNLVINNKDTSSFLPNLDKPINISYTLQQKDSEGVYDITRSCKSIKEFLMVFRQTGLTRISKTQQIIKRIEMPITISSLEDTDADQTRK